MTYEPTAIDLSRIPAPDAIEVISLDKLDADFRQRFLAEWAIQQSLDNTLPDFTEQALATHPAIVVGRAWRYLRNLDRNRVNDGLKALLAPLSKGSNLENLVAGRNLSRLTIAPASAAADAVMEGDEALFLRYLLSFDEPAASSSGRYLFDAWTAWPQSADKSRGLWDARVNGRAVHGRRGDTDVVLIGPFGREPTVLELAAVRTAVLHVDRTPEAVSVSIMAASRSEYRVSLRLEIAGSGPSPDLLKAEAQKRVMATAIDRTVINGEIPAGLLSGAAYGPGIVRVIDLAPVIIQADPYKVPVMTKLDIAVEAGA